MRRLMTTLLLGCCMIGVAQDTSGPPDHGVYYRNKDGWQKLELLTAGGRLGAINRYRFSSSPIQISDRRPIFYIRASPDKKDMLASVTRNIAIVKLEQKKYNRELQVASSGLFGAKGGIDKKRMPDVTLHSVNDLMVTVTTNEDLEAGEYLLTWFANGSVGYDFGIK